jgi:serine/threonine-protein kinase
MTTTLAGRYVLRRPLGHGAMAVVDLAQDVELGRPVALKRLAENLARDEEIRRRFLREARLAARLSHPNVVRVYDVGEVDGRPFIAMEYVEGENLAELVAGRGRLPAAEAAALAAQACGALAAAHSAGLVHRDVKPQNLILRSDGTLKLGDFGIAFGGHDATQLTQAGTLLGTAAYVAPEQARGERVTAAADIYGVGAVLYELLTGEPPRRVVSFDELRTDEAFRLPDLAARAPGVPPRLAAAVAQCLAVDPDDRPASAASLARRLAAVAGEAQTLALPDDPARRATEILAPTLRVPRQRRSRRLVLGAAGMAAVAAAAAGVAAALVVSGGGGPAPASHPGTTAVPSLPSSGTPAQQAQELAAWLRRNAG